MKTRKKKVFVAPEGDLYVVRIIEFKPNQYVYEYEIPQKRGVFEAMVANSPKSLGMKCVGAL